MSPSSANLIAIGLGACDVALGARRSALQRFADRAGVRRKTPHPAALPVTTAIAADQRYTERGVLEALRRALAVEAAGQDAAVAADAGDAGHPSRPARAKRRASIVLDDFWGHHAILRGDFRTVRARDAESIARAYFADTFSVDEDALAIRWQLQGGGRAMFASAVPRSLHDGVRELGAAAQIEVASFTLGLSSMLNRVRRAVNGSDAVVLVIAETLLHAVTIEDSRWVAYDTQRLFADDAGDASRLAEVARHLFERTPTRRRDDCDVYLCGLAVDPIPFAQHFARVRELPGQTSGDAAALRLMEFAT